MVVAREGYRRWMVMALGVVEARKKNIDSVPIAFMEVPP